VKGSGRTAPATPTSGPNWRSSLRAADAPFDLRRPPFRRARLLRLARPANYLSLNATGCMTSKLSGVGCSFQFGRASAPMIPQRTHTIPWAEGQDRNVVGPIGAQDRRVAA
jgi:hypothetical protein